MDTIISILSIFVASLSLCYTIKTYKSQRRTEKNTLRWSPQRERENLRSIARELVFSYRKLLTIEYKLAHSEIRKRPQISSFVFSAMMINESALHVDDYYGDEVDYEGLY